jgi:hypothetical protein
MKKTLLHLILVALAGIILGMMIYRNNWFPISIYRKAIESAPLKYSQHYPYGIFYIPYTMGVPLFSDRPYCDTIGNKELENSHVIQLPRHYQTPIEIEVDKEVIVYRILTENNDNSVFKDWSRSNIKVFIKGKSCAHTYIVQKKFHNEIVQLQTGAATASSPIIIKTVSNTPLTSLRINGRIIYDKFGLYNCQLNSN